MAHQQDFTKVKDNMFKTFPDFDKMSLPIASYEFKYTVYDLK